MRNKQIILYFFFIIFNIVIGQETSLNEIKNELIILSDTILKGQTDKNRIEANNEFSKLLLKAINKKKSYLYDFRNIGHLSALQPKDKNFVLFTWFLPYKDGTFQYFGIIQKCKRNGKKCETYWLEETTLLNNNIKKKQLKTEDWYGCLYYDIIPIKVGKEKYYTLLGWDGNNSKTTKKIIDVLKFSKQERPHFGASIFNNNQHRIIIEYSSAYPISLKYDQKLNYIVYDHIEPIDGISINNFNIYATNLSYDILQKTEFGWELKENIYLNNEK